MMIMMILVVVIMVMMKRYILWFKTRIFVEEATGPPCAFGEGSVRQNTGTVLPKVLNQSPAGLEVRKDGTTTFSPDWKVSQTSLSNMICSLLFP